MMTANDIENQRLLVLNAGADDFLLKPFNIEVLLQRINAVLNSRAGFD
jgi:DNA-binding response OmpR family regulator